MNFTILAKELKKGLSFTEKITGKNLTLPILNNLLIEALPNFLKISSTDLEVGIEWWGHCKTEKEGSIAVPAKFISQLVGVLPEEKIDIKTKGNTLLIEGKNIKTQIKGFSSEEFPIIPKFLKDIYIEMDGKKLKDGLISVVDMVSTSQVKPEISGVYFSFNKGSIKLVATDSFRLAEKTIKDDFKNLFEKEETFMTTLLDKIPGMAASQRAYIGFLNKLRMDLFDDLIKKAKLAGEDVSLGSKAAEDIATIINAFSGGYGKTDPLLNALLFSPRRVWSAVKILNPWTYINPKTSKTARKAAIRNLLGSLAMTGSVIALAGLHGAVETEEDPRSSDFGKIKVGDTRLDISGGIASYVILLSRILSGEIKSSNTGAIKKLGNNYTSTSGFDLTANFIRNKLSPLASLIIDVLTGENAVGEKKTPTQSVIDRFKPMFLKDAYEVLTDDSTGVFVKAVLTVLALFGAGLSTYSISEDWTTKDTKEMAQFKQKVGEKEFKAANEKYNQIIRKEIEALKKTDKYKKMTPDEQLKEITKIKDKAKKDIFKQYNFQYKKSLPSKK